MNAQQRLVFGEARDPGVVEELVERGGERVKNGKGQLGAFKSNPLVPLYGPGPDGAICRDCVHLTVRRFSRNYYKCDLRRDAASPVSDHRVRWPACGKYEAEA
jgi:hypothetical protein